MCKLLTGHRLSLNGGNLLLTFPIDHPFPPGTGLGTCSDQLAHNWSSATNFEWAQAESTSPFTGYDSTMAAVSTTFDDVDTSGNYCWRNSSSRRDRFGGDVNNGDNASDNYVGLAGAATYSSFSNRWYIDEIAIMIY